MPAARLMANAQLLFEMLQISRAKLSAAKAKSSADAQFIKCLLKSLYFFRKMAYPISNRISTPMVAKMPHTNSGINI